MWNLLLTFHLIFFFILHFYVDISTIMIITFDIISLKFIKLFSDSESGDEPLIVKAKKKKLNEISSPETDRSNNNVNSRSTRSRKAASQINGDSIGMCIVKYV